MLGLLESYKTEGKTSLPSIHPSPTVLLNNVIVIRKKNGINEEDKSIAVRQMYSNITRNKDRCFDARSSSNSVLFMFYALPVASFVAHSTVPWCTVAAGPSAHF